MSEISWLNGPRKYLKVADLTTPIQGIFVGILQEQYSPVYKIQTKSGLVSILGNKSLNAYMVGVSLGTEIAIMLDKLVPLKNGNTMAIAKVGLVKSKALSDDGFDMKEMSIQSYGQAVLPSFSELDLEVTAGMLKFSHSVLEDEMRYM